MIIANFAIPKDELPLLAGYLRLRNLLSAFNPTIDERRWRRLPSDISEATTGWIPVANEDDYLRRAARDMGDVEDRWPMLGAGFEATVTTASDEADWNNGGQITLEFSPKTGKAQIEVYEASTGDMSAYYALRSMFIAICSELDVSHARCDVTAPNPDLTIKRQTAYSVQCRVFPHREFFGWMGYVNRKIEPAEVPEADELIYLPKRNGTVIVVVAGVFDVHDMSHVEKAQRVEMRLVDLDALPIIDPRFLK